MVACLLTYLSKLSNRCLDRVEMVDKHGLALGRHGEPVVETRDIVTVEVRRAAPANARVEAAPTIVSLVSFALPTVSILIRLPYVYANPL